MLTIYNGRSHFWQWDVDQKLKVDVGHACEVHFRNPDGETALVVETYTLDGWTVANVPNVLLQRDGSVSAWVYICEADECTKYQTSFDVWPRQKPADYVYTETEVKTYSDLEARVAALEEKDGVQTDTMNKVDAMIGGSYVKFTGAQALTPEQQNQARQNMGLYYAESVTQRQHAHEETVMHEIMIGAHCCIVRFNDADFDGVEACTVVIDGKSYETPVKYVESIGVYIGNGHVVDDTLEDTGEEWVLVVEENRMYGAPADAETISVYSASYEGIHTIDPRWLPDYMTGKQVDEKIQAYVDTAILNGSW